MYDLKSTEMPLAGYTLVLRGPLLHQHKAVVAAFEGMDLSPLMEAVKPAMAAAASDTGGFAHAAMDAVPKAIKAFVDRVLSQGIETCVEAAAICLDTRANHRRLSGHPTDEDFDRAKVAEFEPGADGSTYLRCDSLRAFVRANITVDAAIWVLFESIRLGGYGDLGKALLRTVATTMGNVAAMTPAPKRTETITA